MARSTFGATLADYAVQPANGLWGVAPGAAITFWDARTGGTQYTDLLDAGGVAVSGITADEYGVVPGFQGPDGVTAMWADAGGSSRAWIAARGGGGRGGGGGGGTAAYTSLVRVVASSTAPADVRAAAAYVCDGTADQAEIQAAIDAAQNDGGGRVLLSVGDFDLTAPLSIAGTANEDNLQTVTVEGCGEFTTILRPASDVNAVEITNWAQCHLRDFGIVISGAGSGIVATAVTTGSDTRSFWDSSFRNLRINGEYDPTRTGWAMDMEMPFRSVFDNIEIEGVRNGLHISNNSAIQNAGDCTFSRMFIELVGDNGTAIHVESITGNMNQNNWSMVEAANSGGTGAGTTGILLDGAAGSASQRFWGTNLEQFDTLIRVDTGESNVFDLNYVTCRDGAAGNKAFVCGAYAFNNRFSAKWVNVADGDSLSLLEDANTTDEAPNTFDGIRIEANPGSTVTCTAAASTVLRDIIGLDTGSVQSGLLQHPRTDTTGPLWTPADHGLIGWTQDPATLGAGTDPTTAGVLYLLAVKVPSPRTISTVHIGVAEPGSGLTAGQNLAGLYDSAGTLLSGTADQSGSWTSAGHKAIALSTAQDVGPGVYYVAFLANGTTPPPLLRGHSYSSSTLNAGLTAANARFLTSGTGQTALPASVALGSGDTDYVSRWAAVS
ncbi:hypothetical protein ACL02U_02135 [Streptomyces sp. MS06]|uniref:hypothetical protein n=1 Tax=Streptomyces sp. MS06 TaxID=3385974 RepID=UPI0039A1DCEF